jgi:hypothetical protein
MIDERGSILRNPETLFHRDLRSIAEDLCYSRLLWPCSLETYYIQPLKFQKDFGGNLLSEFLARQANLTVTGPDLVAGRQAYCLNFTPHAVTGEASGIPSQLWLSDLGNGEYCPVQVRRSGPNGTEETIMFTTFGYAGKVPVPSGWTYTLAAGPGHMVLETATTLATFSNVNSPLTDVDFRISYPATASVYTEGVGWRFAPTREAAKTDGSRKNWGVILGCVIVAVTLVVVWRAKRSIRSS